MRYNRSSNSNTIRTITAKFTGKCSCCGGEIKAGAICDYWPAKKTIAHYKGWEGNSTACYHVQCAEMESKGLPTSRKPDPGFVDLDRAYAIED